MIHKIKGGAQLLSAQRFIKQCEALEIGGTVSDRANAFVALLEEQNQIIDCYLTKYASH
jgi:two-component system sensor histidine kinase EvgS